MVRARVVAGFLLTLAASCLAQDHQHQNGEYPILIFNSPKLYTPEGSPGVHAEEVPAILQIYLDGKMDQFCLCQDWKIVVLIMTTDSAPKKQIQS